MSESTQIIVGVILLIGVYLLTRKFHAWQMRRAYTTVLKDLEQREAFDPSSAVELPYAKVGIFRMGTRDYRPKAIQYMTQTTGVAVMTADGKYYLRERKGNSPFSEQ